MEKLISNFVYSDGLAEKFENHENEVRCLSNLLVKRTTGTFECVEKELQESHIERERDTSL